MIPLKGSLAKKKRKGFLTLYPSPLENIGLSSRDTLSPSRASSLRLSDVFSLCFLLNGIGNDFFLRPASTQ